MASVPVEVLVGSTGFVGGNLCASHEFNVVVHSADVQNSFGLNADLLVYAGVPGTYFLANENPDLDRAIVEEARDNIRKINAQRVVLVSTINVYSDSRGKDEISAMGLEGLGAYGTNRLLLERWVREDFPDALIVRLPAIYGSGLKKNFLFDLAHMYPPMLSERKYRQLAGESSLVERAYSLCADGYCRVSPGADRAALGKWFCGNDFNALSFTDSRSRFQFYSLAELWGDICWALDRGLYVLNIATPPVSAGEVYEYVTGRTWVNELSAAPFDYDMRSVHFPNDRGESGYKESRDDVLRKVCAFVRDLTCEVYAAPWWEG